MNDSEGHIDPTFEISLETVKKRAVKGIITLTGRTAVLNIISFVSQGLLWAFLDPSQFGVFLVVSATVNFLSYFADIGLGAALVQKKETPTKSDLSTVFVVQEILVVSVSIALLAISPTLVSSHSLSQDGVHLLYALTFAFFLASLKNIPSILLERKLEFGKFVIPQVIEQVVYNVVVVLCAWKGLGITSFTYAVIARGVVGLVAIYILQPWKPSFAFSKKSLRNLLTFGVPYQINNFLATVKDDGMTIVLGNILGSSGVGILGTAQKLAQYPLRFFMDNVTKVTFPAFSRLQDNTDHLSSSLTRSIYFICALVFPSIFGLIILFPDLLVAIPKYDKWASAFVPLLFVSVNSLMAAFTTQLTNFLNAVGKIKTTFKLMVMWTALTWLFVPLLGRSFGVVGAAAGYGLVGLSSFVAVILVKRIIKFSIWRSIGVPLASALAMSCALVVLLALHRPTTIVTLVGYVLAGAVIYFASTYVLVGKQLVVDVRQTAHSLFHK